MALGQYIIDNPEGPTAFDTLNQNVSQVGQFLLQKQLFEQQKKKDLKEKIQLALLKNMQLKAGADPNAILDQATGGVNFSQFENKPAQLGKASTSISISQRPFTEVLKAREEISRTPEEWGKAGMATKEQIPGSGWFGSNFLAKDKWNLNPEAVAIQEQARNIIQNPNRVTQRVSNGGQFTGQSTMESPSALPDMEGYEEGDVIEDDDGNQYELKNGQWIAL